ncbi:phage tail fiber protein [Proteus mirabilis]
MAITSLKCNDNPEGTFTTNDESEGATVTRVGQGEYLIEGVLGFNLDCSGQLKLATVLEFFQYLLSDSFWDNPPLYS